MPDVRINLQADDGMTPVVGAAQKELEKLNGTLVDIQDYMGGGAKSMADMAAASEGAIGSINSLNAELKQLTAELNELDPETEQFAQHAQDIQAVQGRLAELKGQVAGTGQDMSEFWKSTLAAATGFSLASVIGQATQGLKDFGVASLQAADDMNAVHNRAEMLFGADFSKVAAQADGLAASFGRNSTQMLDFETHLGTVAESLGLSSGQAEQMSTDLTTLSLNMAKAFHTDDAETLHAIEMALEGNVRGLRQYDIAISTKTLDDYAEAQGITEKVSKMDAEQKAILTYHYLMDKTHAIQQAGIQDTGDLSDSIKTLQAEWLQFEQNLGSVFLPLAENVVGMFSTWLGWVNDLGTGVREVTKDFGDMAWAIGYLTGITQPTSYAGPKLGGFDLSMGDVANLKPSKAAPKGGGKPGWASGFSDTAGSAKAAKALEALQTELNSLGNTYDQTTTTIDDKLDQLDKTHADKVASIQASFEKLKTSLDDLQTKYQETMTGITTSEEDAVGKQDKTIADLQRKLDDFQHQKGALTQDQLNLYSGSQYGRQHDANGQAYTGNLSQAEINAFGLDATSVAQTNTYMQLQKAQKELDDFKKKGILTPDQMQAGDANANMSGFEKSIATDEAKKAKDKQDFEDKKKDIEDQMAQLLKKAAVEQQAYGIERSEIVQTQSQLKGFHDELVIAMEHMELVTKQKVTAMKEELKDLGQTMKSASADLMAQNRLGGTSGNSPSTAGNVTINFGDVQVRNETDLNALVQKVTRALQLQQSGSQ